MAESLIVEVLDQLWNRKGVTGLATKARVTEELGQVGDGDIEVSVDDPVVESLPNPDATNPYEGRFRLYEDDSLVFAGVIDSKTISLNDSTVKFNGKQRGIELGFQNLGRVDYLGWHLRELLQELVRNNIGKQAALSSVTSQQDDYGAYQMTTGDPFKQNYWKSVTSTGTHTATFDLGASKAVTAIRVMPQWWKDIDTGKFHWHQFTIQTSPDGSSWTTRGTKSNTYPSTAKGHLYEFTADIRYFRINVTSSTDGYARIAQIMVYEDIATIGGDTTYTVPFVENDDSGNVVTSGSPTRPIVPGAFQGDGVITHSYVTRLLSSGQKVTHTFRGISNAVYFTSHNNGAGTADIYVDGVFRETVSIPNNKYWFKGYDTMDDFGGPLSDTQHTLEVRWASGVVQVDYFNGLFQTSWRPIEDDDPSLGYVGNWTQAESAGYHNFFSSVSTSAGNVMWYSFIGDKFRIIGSKGSGFGSFEVYVDGSGDGTHSTAGAAADKQQLYEWSGTYGAHTIRVVTTSTARVVIDRIEGNFNHTLYLRSRYETNLKLLIRMSEIIDSYIRFNHDGSIDLVGAVGESSNTAILEGYNEGGSMENATIENDYAETGSAVLAIVNVNGELPIKAFVIDREAVAEIGYKVIKLEQSDAADQFLLNRQALQYLREKRKPERSYTMSYDPDTVGDIEVGQTTRIYSPTSGMDDTYRVGRIVTEYS
jgi:hypothetical protein